MKFIILFCAILSFVNGTDILVSSKNIKYQEVLDFDTLFITTTNKKIRCQMFDKPKLLTKTYQAKHYIFKGKAICNKDVQVVEKHKIRYDFGNIIIERDGKVIGENKKYIKVKNLDGSVEKIYKNGQLK